MVTTMHDERLKSLYDRLLAQRPELAARTAPYRVARALRGDAEQLSAGIARLRAAGRAPRRSVPAWGWALAATLALAAVFATRQPGPDLGAPQALPPSDRTLVADAPEPLFSGSFERSNTRPAEAIFDSSFGS